MKIDKIKKNILIIILPMVLLLSCVEKKDNVQITNIVKESTVLIETNYKAFAKVPRVNLNIDYIVAKVNQRVRNGVYTISDEDDAYAALIIELLLVLSNNPEKVVKIQNSYRTIKVDIDLYTVGSVINNEGHVVAPSCTLNCSDENLGKIIAKRYFWKNAYGDLYRALGKTLFNAMNRSNRNKAISYIYRAYSRSMKIEDQKKTNKVYNVPLNISNDDILQNGKNVEIVDINDVLHVSLLKLQDSSGFKPIHLANSANQRLFYKFDNITQTDALFKDGIISYDMNFEIDQKLKKEKKNFELTSLLMSYKSILKNNDTNNQENVLFNEEEKIKEMNSNKLLINNYGELIGLLQIDTGVENQYVTVPSNSIYDYLKEKDIKIYNSYREGHLKKAIIIYLLITLVVVIPLMIVSIKRIKYNKRL